MDVDPSKWSSDGGLPIRLKMLTTASFKDYAIALWDVPRALADNAARIETNAKEFLLARNTDGEFSLGTVFRSGTRCRDMRQASRLSRIRIREDPISNANLSLNL